MPPKKVTGKGEKGKGKGKAPAEEVENGVESSAPDVDEEVPTAPVVTTQETAGDEMEIEEEGESSESKGRKGKGKKAEENVGKKGRKRKLLMSDKEHPFHAEYSAIPVGKDGEKLTHRQLLILCRKDIDPEERKRRASLYFAKNGLIYSKYRPDRPPPKTPKDGSAPKVLDRFDRITEEDFADMGMTRADLPAFATGGIKTKGEKLENFDVQMGGAGEGLGEQGVVMGEDGNAEEETDDVEAAIRATEEEMFTDQQMSQHYEIDAAEAAEKKKLDKGKGKGKEISQPGQSIASPLDEEGLTKFIKVIWNLEMDTFSFKLYRRNNPIRGLGRKDITPTTVAKFKPESLTFESFARQIYDAITTMGQLINFAEKRRLVPHQIQFHYDEGEEGKWKVLEMRLGDESIEEAVALMCRLKTAEYRIVVGLEMVGAVALAIFGIQDLDES